MTDVRETLSKHPLAPVVMAKLFDLGLHVQARVTDDNMIVITYFPLDNPPDSNGNSKRPWPPIKVLQDRIRAPAGSLETVVFALMGM